MIKFRTLGGVDLRDPSKGDLQAVLAGPKRVALLAYLTLARPDGFHHRDTLLGLFWPEVSQKRGRRALSQALYVLRRGLGEGVVTVRGPEEVGLDRARLWCDAEAFEQKLAAGERAVALELYGGQLLNGFSLAGCPEFELWLAGERERLEGRATAAARERAEELAASGEAVEAVFWLRRALRWTPYDEELLQRLLLLLGGLGDRVGVVREYEAFANRLAEDLDLEPSPETLGLVERVRSLDAETRIATVEAVSEKLAPGAGGREPASADRELTRGREPRNRWRRAGWAAGLAAAGGALAIVLFIVLRGPQTLESASGTTELDPRRVVLLPFQNQSDEGDLEPLGRMAADWIAQELARTGLVRPILPVNATIGLRLMEGPEVISEDQLSSAARLGAGLVLAGTFAVERDSLVWRLMIVRVPTGEIVRTIDRVAGSRGNPVSSFDALRQRATGALAALVDERLAPWAGPGSSQPPSYAAYRAFAEGMELRERQNYRAAAAAFHRAAMHDSTFTAPLVWAMMAHDAAVYYPDETQRDQRQAELADSLVRYLEQRREALPPLEAAMLEVELTRRRSDWRAKVDALKRVTDLTPEPMWLLRLAQAYIVMNRPEEALRTVSLIDPGEPLSTEWRSQQVLLMNAHHVLGNYEQELEILQKFLARYPPTRPVPPRSVPVELYEIRVLAGLGRKTELARAMEELQARATEPGIWMEAMEARIHGHPEIARRAWEWQLKQYPLREPPDDPGETWRWGLASALWALGRWDEAEHHWKRMLEQVEPGSDNVIYFLGSLGVIAAHREDRVGALNYDRRLADLDLEPFHEPTLVHAVRLQRIQIAVALGERKRAIAMLEEAIEEGLPFWNTHPEMFNPELLELRGDPAYEALVRPR